MYLRSKQPYNETIDDYLVEPDIHEQRYQEFSGAPLVLIFAALLTVGHVLNAYLLLWQDMPVFFSLILHVALVAVAGVLVFLLHKASLDTRMARLMFITSAVMGPVATVGTILATLLATFYVRYRSSFDEWYSSIFPRGIPSLPEEIMDALQIGRDENPYEYSVIPFMDVMEVGNEAQKRHALSRMASAFTPRFAPAFKKALSDNSSAIRVQAATAVSKIENNFHDKLLKIAQLHREFPQNPIITKALAQYYDDYAFTGILDEQREKVNRQKARELYTDYLRQRPEDVEVRLKVGRLYVREEQIQQAVDWFKHSLDEGYATDPMKLWYMECLFRAGRYDELRAAASTFRIDLTNYKELQPEMVESVHLWAQAGVSASAEKVAS